MRFNKISKEQYATDFALETNACTYDEIKLPQRATKFSAGYDIYSPCDFTLRPGETIKFPTGINVELDPDKVLLVVPRSGHGFKYGVRLSNTCGVIDADYINSDNEGHVWVKLHYPADYSLCDGAIWTTQKPLIVKKGDAVCQGIIMQYFTTEDDAAETERNGGFGSTSN